MSSRTKALAKQLGLITRIKASETATEKSNANTVIKQQFDYLLVLDFESTCWEDRGRTPPRPEIIEFPAVLLHLNSGDIVDRFQQYVFPVEQPRLSAFCEKFTGITQSIVEKGVPLPTCLFLFKKWLSALVEKYNLVFHDPRCVNNDSYMCTMATWSDWDLTVCLDNECRRKNIFKPGLFNSWIDLRLTYSKFYNRKPNGLKGALEDLGLRFEGQEHCGLDDSQNTARLAFKMVQDGCFLEITKSLGGIRLTAKTNEFAQKKSFWR